MRPSRTVQRAREGQSEMFGGGGDFQRIVFNTGLKDHPLYTSCDLKLHERRSRRVGSPQLTPSCLDADSDSRRRSQRQPSVRTDPVIVGKVHARGDVHGSQCEARR